MPAPWPRPSSRLFCGVDGKSVLESSSGHRVSSMEKSRPLFPPLSDDVALHILCRVARSSLPAVRRVCRSWKSLAEGRELYEVRQQLGNSEAWVYLVAEASGYDQPQLFSFDPAAAQYHHVSGLPPKLSAPSMSVAGKSAIMQRQDFGLVPVGADLLLFGGTIHIRLFGRRPFAGVWLYNVPSKRWRQAAPMSMHRAGFACGAIGGKVYIAGGRDRLGLATTSAEVYDVGSDTWTPLPPMQAARHICTGAVLNGKLYVMGCGDQWRCQPQNLLQLVRMEVYDPASGCWSQLAIECPAPKVWGVPWHDQAMPVASDLRLYWIGCGALKLRFYDAAANAFVGYFENELCAFDSAGEGGGVAGFLHGPSGGVLQARESCGLAAAQGRLLVLGGCLFDAGGLPTIHPSDVQVHSPTGPAVEAGGSWQTLSLQGGSLCVGKVWRCCTMSL